MLGRDTEWRQGSLLTDADAHALSLVDSLDSGKRVVVISHDCDLPNDAEEFVEVIVGTIIPKPDSMLVKARNPRRLHIEFASEAGEHLYIELRHADRQQVRKDEFAKLQSGDMSFALSADEKRGLKQWLAARYGRPAFPNAFENWLRKKSTGKKTVEQCIAKILEPESQHLVGVFFDLGEERTVELPDGEPYVLSISIVYDATEGGQTARDSAEKVAERLRLLFHDVYGTPDIATEIALEVCNAVADTFMSLADLRKVDQWRLEYISLREDPAGDFLAVGEMPP
jgi:hypothetical protein